MRFFLLLGLLSTAFSFSQEFPEEKQASLKQALKNHPCDEEAIKGLHKKATRWAHERENYERAAELYRWMIECQPDNVQFNLEYGELLQAMKQFNEAEKALKKALKADPSNIDVLIALSNLAAARGKRDLSDEYLQKVMKTEPCDERTIQALAEDASFWEKRYPTRANKIYRFLLKCRPDDAYFLYRASKVAYRLGDFKKSTRYLLKLSRQDPKNIRYLHKLGQSALREDEDVEGARAYIQMLKTEECDDFAVERLGGLLPILMKKKEYEMAKEAAIYALDCRPGRVQYLLTYAEASYKLGQQEIVDETALVLQKDIIDFKKYNLKAIYLLIWDEKYEEALDRLDILLDEHPCNETIIYVMDEAIARLTKSKKNLERALSTYLTLINCYPDSPIYYYRIGIVMNRMGDSAGAKEYFKKALAKSPSFMEAELELSSLYLREKDYDRAMEISMRYPDAYQSRENFGRMYLEDENFPSAEYYFYNLIEEYPTSDDAKLLYAKSLVKQKRFKSAQMEYDRYLVQVPHDRFTWRELFEFKAFTDPLIGFSAHYLESKEEDPSLKAFVVKNYYFRSRYYAFFPISDRARFTIEGDYGFEKENNIFGNGGRNYDVEISEVRAGWHYLIGNHWKIDLFNRVKIGNRLNNSLFPFQNRAKEEPGGAISYSSKDQEFILSGYYDSFIVKNRQQTISQLLRRQNVDLYYQYTYLEHPIYPRIGAVGEINYYEDRFENRRRRIGGHFAFDIPYLQDYITFTYRALYSEFAHLSPDYNTYFHRWEHFLTVEARYILNSDTIFRFNYEHAWQFTKGQVLPVGVLIFVTPKQRIISNRYTALVSRSLGDSLFLEAFGSVMESDLRYRNWQTQAALVYHF